MRLPVQLGGPFFAAIVSASTAVAAGEPVVLEAGPDWDLTLTGQIRPRATFHSGRDFLGDRSEWREYVTQRARVGATFENSSGLSLAVELQDVRAWGEETSTLDASADGFDAHQAYALIPAFGDFWLTLGRQEIVFDGERLVSNLDWFQQGRSFDGGRLTFHPEGSSFSVDGFYAKVLETGQPPEGAVPGDREGDVDFAGLHASYEPIGGHELSPVYLVDADQAIDRLAHTLGLYAHGEESGLEYQAEFYYQFGTLDEESIEAYLAAGRLAYTLDLSVKPRAALWADVLSGDGSRDDAFDLLYGDVHAYYGEMDFFLSPVDTAFLGLIDLGGRLETGIVEGLRARADAHYFMTYGAPDSEDHELGLELDFQVGYEPMDYVELTALFGVFFPGDAIAAIRGYDALGVDASADSLVYVTADAKF